MCSSVPAGGPVGRWTEVGRWGGGRGMLGGVPADQVAEAGGQAQAVEHVESEPPQKDPFIEADHVRIPLPHTGERLHGNAQAVDAGRLLHCVGLQPGELQARSFLGELSQQSRFHGGVTRGAPAPEKSEDARLPDSLPLLAQMQQVATRRVVDERGGVDRFRLGAPGGSQKLLPQCGGGDLVEGHPDSGRDPLGLHCGVDEVRNQVEDEPEIVVVAGGFTLGRVDVDGVVCRDALVGTWSRMLELVDVSSGFGISPVPRKRGSCAAGGQ